MPWKAVRSVYAGSNAYTAAANDVVTGSAAGTAGSTPVPAIWNQGFSRTRSSNGSQPQSATCAGDPF